MSYILQGLKQLLEPEQFWNALKRFILHGYPVDASKLDYYIMHFVWDCL